MDTIIGIIAIVLFMLPACVGMRELYVMYVAPHAAYVQARNEAQHTLHAMRMEDEGVVGDYDPLYDTLVALLAQDEYARIRANTQHAWDEYDANLRRQGWTVCPRGDYV